MYERRNYLVSLQLDTSTEPPRIQFSAPPSIPPDTIATITLAPHSSSEDFKFESFAWCVSDPAATPFLSAAVNHGDSLVVLVKNNGGASIGKWSYQVGVCTSHGVAIESPACGGDHLPEVINESTRTDPGQNMREPVIIPERRVG